jgi:hypothetical protein
VSIEISPAAGGWLSVIRYQQEALSLIQQETGELVGGANNRSPSSPARPSKVRPQARTITQIKKGFPITS